jgi:hypothetical protein
MTIVYTECDPQSKTWTGTDGAGTWADYDIYTNQGIPKGAVAEIVMCNGAASGGADAGIKTDDATCLFRYVNLNEAESGGENSVMFPVVVHKTTGLVKCYQGSGSSNITFRVIGYFTGCTFEQSQGGPDDCGANTTWTPYSILGGSYGSNRVHVILISTVTSDTSETVGAREPGSSLGRVIVLHEPEGNGEANFVTLYTKANSSGEIEFYQSSVANTNIYDYGYFGPEVDFVEGFTELGYYNNGNWTEHNVTAQMDTTAISPTEEILTAFNNLNNTNKRVGQRITLNQIVVKVMFRLMIVGAPTGTLYCRIRSVSDDSIIETSSDTVNVPSISNEEYVSYWFTLTSTINEEVRILLEYANGSATNYVKVKGVVSDIVEGQLTYYTTSYTDTSGYDTDIIILAQEMGNKYPTFLAGTQRSDAEAFVGLRSPTSSVLRYINVHESEGITTEFNGYSATVNSDRGVLYIYADSVISSGIFYYTGYFTDAPNATVYRELNQKFNLKSLITRWLSAKFNIAQSGASFYINGTMISTPDAVERTGVHEIELRVDWHDEADLADSGYTVNFYLRDPSLTVRGPYTGSITKEGSKEYNATYTLDINDAWNLGMYDLKAVVLK